MRTQPKPNPSLLMGIPPLRSISVVPWSCIGTRNDVINPAKTFGSVGLALGLGLAVGGTFLTVKGQRDINRYPLSLGAPPPGSVGGPLRFVF